MRKVKCRIWDRESKLWITVEGLFHQWGVNYEEFQYGPGNYSIGIVELPGGRVVTPLADDVHFEEADHAKS
jgi:hypothetical protein